MTVAAANNVAPAAKPATVVGDSLKLTTTRPENRIENAPPISPMRKALAIAGIGAVGVLMGASMWATAMTFPAPANFIVLGVAALAELCVAAMMYGVSKVPTK